MGRNILQAVYISLALLLFIVALTFTFANTHVDRVINDIFVSIANGASINDFNRVILGLLSNAKFRIIDTNLAGVVSVISLVLSYLFLQAYLFTKRGIPFRKILRVSYWTTFIPTLGYRTYYRKDDDA